MTDVPVPPSPRSSVVSCWKRAIETHNSTLRNGDTRKRYIPFDAIEPHGHAPDQQQIPGEHPSALLGWAEKYNADIRKKGGPLAEGLRQVARAARHYSRAIDVFVQCNPTVAGLVWGSIRVLLQIGEEAERTSCVVSEGILEIILHEGRWEEVVGSSNLFDSERLEKRLVELYVAVLDFLLSSKQWCDRGRLSRTPSLLSLLEAAEMSWTSG
ncbi:hypothetical protein B0T16DRAFT_105265 [Cercophora newfieldiana]|uniref:DUF7708 domain-containing protein n=1 Tax=Cercophora newfieldiana TaxID=92897 RepID=A0AA39YHL3_9PEZI|nr:hypothetical protein B0T16DRAFT_105265 [Cercophora newfieldiana]